MFITKCEVMPEDSEDLAFLNHFTSVTRIFLATTAHCHDRAAINIHITHFTRIFNEEFWAAENQIISIVFGTNIYVYG